MKKLCFYRSLLLFLYESVLCAYKQFTQQAKSPKQQQRIGKTSAYLWLCRLPLLLIYKLYIVFVVVVFLHQQTSSRHFSRLAKLLNAVIHTCIRRTDCLVACLPACLRLLAVAACITLLVVVVFARRWFACFGVCSSASNDCEGRLLVRLWIL